MHIPWGDRWPDAVKFVGRDDELTVFAKVLTSPLKGPRSILIQGSGGVGKTWLIKRMLLSVADKPGILALAPDKLLDMYSTSNRHLEGVMNALEERLTEQMKEDGPFQVYRDARLELMTARSQVGYSDQEINRKVKELAVVFRECMQRLTQTQTLVVAFDTFENVQDSDLADWILSNNGLQMPNLVCLIGTRRSLGSDQKEIYTSVREINLTGLSNDEAVKFYLRYIGEESVNEERIALIQELNEKAGCNPLLLGLAIFWMDLPDNSPDAVRRLSQVEFEQAIVMWVSPRNESGSVIVSGVEYNEPMRQTLIFMAYLNRRFNLHFLNCLVNAGYIQLYDMNVDDLWNMLMCRKPDMFYVKERPEGEIQLHDKLAEILRKYVLVDAFRDASGEALREFTGKVVSWYDELIGKAENPDLLYVEQLAYLLRSDIYNDCQQQPKPKICGILNLINPQAQELIDVLETHRRRRSDILARLVVNEVKLPLIQRFSDIDQYEIYKLLGQIASQSYQHETAQGFWKKAIQAALRLGDAYRQVEGLVGLHNSTQRTNPLESLEILKHAEKICEEQKVEILLPTVLYEIGFTHYLLHHLPESNIWYERAMNQAAQHENAIKMPTILNDLGYNYLLMGEIARARVSIRAARDFRLRKYEQLRQRLELSNSALERNSLDDQLKDAALHLGMSYSTLGSLARYSGRMDEAIERYSEALIHFQEAKSMYWQTRMYFSRGEAYRRRAVASFIAGRLTQSKEFEDQAESDIQKSLRDCEQYGYLPDSITAIRRFGRLHHDRMFRSKDPEQKLLLLDQARNQFVEAYNRAEKIQDILEMLENLTEIAFLSDDYMSILKTYDKEQYEKVKVRSEHDINRLHEYIEQFGKEDNQIYQFPVFQPLWEIEQGAYHFELGEYGLALEKYICGYIGMARIPGYGVARYLQHLDHLVKQLRRLSKQDHELAEQWGEALLNAWEKAGLMDKRPELPQEVQMLIVTAFLYEDEME